jgi:hypothetical protein
MHNAVLLALLATGAAYGETVAAQPSGQQPAADKSLAASLVDKALEKADVITALAQQTLDANVSDHRQGTLIWVRVSKHFLDNYVQRDVDRTKPVHDLILGTRISGESRTLGKTHLVLHPNDDHAVGEVHFEGTVTAKTVGRNGPATLWSDSDSTFRARKSLTITDSGLTAKSAVASAPTRLTPTQIRTSLPRLRGRIAQRIAWRRVNSSRAQADAIASDHTADDVRGDLDHKLDDAVATIQARIKPQVAEANQVLADGQLVVRSRSTPNSIEIALCRPGTPAQELKQIAATVDGNPPVTARVHRAAVAKIMTNDRLRTKYASLFGSSLGGPFALVATSETPARLPLGLKATALEFDGEFLAINFAHGEHQQPEPATRVALEAPPQLR